MYLEHFGLSAPPFQFTASPMALFMSRTHREALAALEWGLLHEPSGLTLLVGESGTGKTTLVCALLARQYRDVRAAYLGNPKLSFMELLGSILSQLGVRGGRSSKSAMINAFTQFALELPLNERIAIMIDEAQTLSDDALEEFRLLSNLERHGRKAAQIVLAGQFELARRLGDPAMRHLNERIGARAVLLPLSALECRNYIEHRLRLSGASSDRIFAGRALDYIVRQSAGIPRRVNALCHNALLLGYSRASKRVTLAMAKDAAADYAAMDQARTPAKRSGWLFARMLQAARTVRPVLGLGLLGVAGFVSGQMLLGHNPAHHLRAWAGRAAASPAIAPIPGTKLDSKAQATAASANSAAASKPAIKESPPPMEESRAPKAPGESGFLEAGLSAPAAAASEPVKPLASASAPSPAPLGAEASSSKRPFVVVGRGDTLSAIAQRHLGSVYSWSNLMRLNPHITNAARVYPGEVVYLPSSPGASSTETTDDTDVE